MKNFFFLILFMTFSFAANAQKSGSTKIISVGVMVLNSSTSQGGAGPSGSSVLSRSEFVWAYSRIGFGAIFDYDLHGSNEKDSAYGIKVEAYLSKFYLETFIVTVPTFGFGIKPRGGLNA